MAIHNQNITVHDRDKVTLRFIVSDNEASIATGEAWWGVGDNESDTGTLRFEKTSGAWNSSSPAQTGGNPGNLSPGTNIQLGTNTITCFLTRSDFGSTIEASELIYHELVYSDNGTGTRSYVVATGAFTLKPSLFTLKGYR